jgi:hypothetical protein
MNTIKNDKICQAFDDILKKNIDLHTYPSIMSVFRDIIQVDTKYASSLQKFKICMDSLMHSVG